METRTQFGRERHNGAGLIVLAVLLLATLGHACAEYAKQS